MSSPSPLRTISITVDPSVESGIFYVQTLLRGFCDPSESGCPSVRQCKYRKVTQTPRWVSDVTCSPFRRVTSQGLTGDLVLKNKEHVGHLDDPVVPSISLYVIDFLRYNFQYETGLTYVKVCTGSLLGGRRI